MRNRFTFLLAAIAVVGAYFFWQNFRFAGLDGVRIEPRVGARGVRPASSGPLGGHGVPIRGAKTIRVASFNLRAFGETKLEKPHVVAMLAQILRQYDVVAIQEIRARSQDVLPRLVDAINSSGAHYDYAIGPRVGLSSSTEQFAFVFDLASIEMDRNQLYTVDDPENLLECDPLVGWFRVRGPATSEAFTFSLVNVHLRLDDSNRELDILDDLVREVRKDGRGEDDVILLGDLNADDRHLGPLGQMSTTCAAIMSISTTVRGGAQLDNILFDETATKEFMGRSGVFDFLREYNLTVEQAVEVSDHLPVWAEFSAFEGGALGRVAELEPATGGSKR